MGYAGFFAGSQVGTPDVAQEHLDDLEDRYVEPAAEQAFSDDLELADKLLWLGRDVLREVVQAVVDVINSRNPNPSSRIRDVDSHTIGIHQDWFAPGLEQKALERVERPRERGEPLVSGWLDERIREARSEGVPWRDIAAKTGRSEESLRSAYGYRRRREREALRFYRRESYKSLERELTEAGLAQVWSGSSQP